MQILTEIEQVFFKHRHIPYLGEVVTQLEHALQTAREDIQASVRAPSKAEHVDFACVFRRLE